MCIGCDAILAILISFFRLDLFQMAPERLRVLKFLGLVIGCTAKFVTGSLFVFNAYQDDLQAIFNYTQKESKCLLFESFCEI